MATRSLTPTVRPFAAHPITRTRETADWEAYRRAADTACAIEAELARVRRCLQRASPIPAIVVPRRKSVVGSGVGVSSYVALARSQHPTAEGPQGPSNLLSTTVAVAAALSSSSSIC
jgi:hypothetical protein